MANLCRTGYLLLLLTSRNLWKRKNSRSEEDQTTVVIMCEFARHVRLLKQMQLSERIKYTELDIEYPPR